VNKHNDGGKVTRWKGGIRLDSRLITVALDSATFRVTPKMWKRVDRGNVGYGEGATFGFGTNFDREPGFTDRATAAQAEIANARKRIEQMERDIVRLRIGIEQMEALAASEESYWTDDPEQCEFARRRRAELAREVSQ
jgi:hypothetical protein